MGHQATIMRAGSAALVLLALSSAGCSKDGGAGAARRARGGDRPIPVAVSEVRPRDVSRLVTVTGPIEPLRSVSVPAQMAGVVLRVLVEEGNRVQAGQLMAELDARETSAQLDRARAVLANAEAAFARAEQLRARDVTSEADLDAARSSHEIAKADVALWSARMAFSRITAPVAGVVTAKFVERGSAVSANDTMFEIADDAQLVVRVRVSELDIVHLEPGRPVTLELDAYPRARIDGRIRRIFPSAEASSRLVPVEVVLGPTPEGVDARPGFLARVSFALDRRQSVIAVPTAAVGVLDGTSFVYVIEADTLVRRPVVTGLTAGGWIEVTSGLASGERVVSSGQANLRPGARVQVSTASPAADGAARAGGGAGALP